MLLSVHGQKTMQNTQQNNVFELRPLAKELSPIVRDKVDALPVTSSIKQYVILKLLKAA